MFCSGHDIEGAIDLMTGHQSLFTKRRYIYYHNLLCICYKCYVRKVIFLGFFPPTLNNSNINIWKYQVLKLLFIYLYINF